MRVCTRSLEVWRMGVVNYLEALKLQDKLVSDRKAGKITDTLLSLQHPPTYTLGKRRTVHNLLVSELQLKSMGTERHYTQSGASLYGVKVRAGESGETGVWVGERKIGAIGFRISSGITSHGLAFNIDPDLSYFEHIVPCGSADKEVTSLNKEVDINLPTEEVIHEQLVSCFERLFGNTNVIWRENPSVYDQQN
ncbi:hypothetical protein ACH5RR_010321 [Cinchona calisaya]|uniref:lipoyl(octanoyl) transferase n=1 Tax=Cinchona calisaya TaxID=153742 RepID=A0ABD3AIL7_9GENT